MSTEVNERLIAHLARSVYAHLRLGGSHTDAGDLWVRYGEPLRIRAVGEGTPLRTELWDYGQGLAVTSRRPAASSTLDLTPEGRAYLGDLRTTRAYGYGAVGRMVSGLSAEVARFRAPSGAIQVDVTTRVPEELGSDDDRVEVALVQLGAGGELLAIERKRVAPGPPVLRLHVQVEAEARQLAVEIFNPALERAAILRVPLDIAGEGGAARVSDLELITAVPRGQREVARGAGWLQSLADARVTGAEAGVLFEIYDLPDTEPYRLRVEFAPAAGGPPIPLAFRPAGESQFDAAFVRSRWPEPTRSTEYLSVRLAGVPPGSHTLRVVAESTDGAAVVAERSIEP